MGTKQEQFGNKDANERLIIYDLQLTLSALKPVNQIPKIPVVIIWLLIVVNNDVGDSYYE